MEIGLLYEQIRQRNSNIRVSLEVFEFIYFTLQAKIKFIDLAHVHTLILAH